MANCAVFFQALFEEHKKQPAEEQKKAVKKQEEKKQIQSQHHSQKQQQQQQPTHQMQAHQVLKKYLDKCLRKIVIGFRFCVARL